MIKNEHANNRDGLLKDIKSNLGEIDTAIEIGTWRAEFSMKMIDHLQPKQFIAVDPYELFEGMVSAPGNEYNSQTSLDKLAGQVSTKLQQRGHNLLRKKSLDASKDFSDNSLDVVYIDGDHTYEGVKTDINAWWPKVKVGGVLCGDDYVESKTGKGFEYGVISAVNEFAEENNVELNIYTLGQRQWLVKK